MIDNLIIPNIEIDTPLKHVWADEQLEIIKEYVESFEATLDNQHEVGVMLTNFGQSVLMQVTSITCRNPVLLIFKGYVNGKEATLIQHVNQLSFMLTTVEKEIERPKRKIGFFIDDK